MKKKLGYICNKCGTINYRKIDEEEIICSNCHNKIDKSVSLIAKNNKKSAERELYELENIVIKDENYIEQLKKCLDLNINNDLTNYLMLKTQRKYDYSFIQETSNYYNLIIEDILRSNFYSKNERIAIINNLNICNRSLYLSILDESCYKTEESKDLISNLYQKDIEIVFNKPKGDNDLSFYKLLIGFGTMILVFIFGLLFEKELSKPIVIILSIIPAVLIGINSVRLLKIGSVWKYLLYFVSIILCYILISYIEIIRYDGFVSVGSHFNSVIHAIPDFVTELLERLDFIDDRFNEPTYERSVRI